MEAPLHGVAASSNTNGSTTPLGSGHTEKRNIVLHLTFNMAVHGRPGAKRDAVAPAPALINGEFSLLLLHSDSDSGALHGQACHKSVHLIVPGQ